MPTLLHRDKPMAVLKLENLQLGRNLIDDLTSTLRISQTHLAGILGVSERSFPNWYNKEISAGKGKFQRLVALKHIVDEALSVGLNEHDIIRILNQPVPGDKDRKALLYYIWESHSHPLTMAVARQFIEQTSSENSMQGAVLQEESPKDIFRRHFGQINDETLKEAASSNPGLVCQIMDSGSLSNQALAAAAEAIGYTLDADHIDRLAKLLEHPNAYVREGAVTALGSFLYHGIEPDKIKAALSYEETSKAVKASITEALELCE